MPAQLATAPVTVAKPRTLSTGRRILVLLAIAFLIAGVLIPPAAGMDPRAPRALGLMAAAVALWMSEAIGASVTGMLAVAGLAVLGILPMNSAGSGLGHPNLWLLLGAYVLTVALDVSGLAKRLALLTLMQAGRSPSRLILLTMAVILGSTFLIPSPVVRTALMIPILTGAVAAAGLAKGSNLPRALFLALGPTSIIASTSVVTGAGGVIYALSLFAELTGKPIGYLRWTLLMLPGVIITLLVLWQQILRMFPQESDPLAKVHATLVDQLRAMGPVRPAEWRTVGLLFFTVLGVVAEPFLHLETSAIFVLAGALTVIPGIGVTPWKDAVKKIDWSTLVLFGSTLSLAKGMQDTKAFNWLINWAAGPELALHPLVLATGVLVLAMIVRLGLTNQTAVAATVIPVVMELAKLHGVNPLWLGMLAVVGAGISYFHVAQSPSLIITHAVGHYPTSDIPRMGIPLMAGMILLNVLIAWFYWPLLGISPR